MRIRTKYAAIAATAVVLISSMAACTSSPDTTPSASSSPQSSSAPASSAPTAGKDQSSTVLDYHLPADIATARSTGATFKPAVTLHIVKFAATDNATVLTFYLTGRHSTEVTGQFLDWANMPAFTDPNSKTVYKVNTYKLKDDPDSGSEGNYRCVCSTITDAGGPSDKVVYTAEYPALRAGTKTVSLTDPRFKTVNVPVSG